MNSPINREKGFTLIELLFAIFIFTIVISAVYGAYRTTFHTIQGSETILEESHRARAALERMTEDLTAIVAGPGGYFLGTEQDLAGARADTMTFVSSTHIPLSPEDHLKGDSVIQYTAELDETNNSIRLLRSDTVKKPGVNIESTSPTNYLLCSGLRQVRYTYYNKEGIEASEWLAEGEEQQDGTIAPPELPAMVTIELIFASAVDEEDGTVFKAAIALPRSLEE